MQHGKHTCTYWVVPSHTYILSLVVSGLMQHGKDTCTYWVVSSHTYILSLVVSDLMQHGKHTCAYWVVPSHTHICVKHTYIWCFEGVKPVHFHKHLALSTKVLKNIMKSLEPSFPAAFIAGFHLEFGHK